jgi:hypothetical protein
VSIWTKDAFLNKAKMYVERAHGDPERGDTFNIWYALALEHLLKAALAATNPLLVADFKHEESVWHGVGLKTIERPKTANNDVLLSRAIEVIKGFEPRHKDACAQITRWRNEELHSGSEPFRTTQAGWLVGYYRAVVVLTQHLGVSLESVLGREEALGADEMITAADGKDAKRVERLIASAKGTFFALPPEAQAAAKSAGTLFVHVTKNEFHVPQDCPACGGSGILEHVAFKVHEERLSDGVIFKQMDTLPRSFECKCCGLRLESSADLDALGWVRTRVVKIEVSPYELFYEPEPDYDDHYD